MRFFSDNAASVHPAVLEAVVAANASDIAYDGDAISARLDAAFSDVFETQVSALWIATGTAANCLALATLCPPFRGTLCANDAHINQDEAGAPEFYSGGGKLITVDAPGSKLTPALVEARLGMIANDVHRTQAAAISITNATEYGLSYAASEVGSLGELAKSRNLRFHMDGARFANAVVHTSASPADLTWRAGVDALSFGFVKNGGLSSEALILFDRDLAEEVRVRRKRAGHLNSKGRFLAAQLLALLKDDLWLTNGRAANDGAARLARAAANRLLFPVQANELFLRMTVSEATELRAQGFQFYDWAEGEVRFVVSWDQDAREIDALDAALAAL
ncbi:L-threonine aldolase [Sphingomonas antarctica]|uniref:threonine aldolase family protein n=1 Tax=Sphingomonas antarctica TaxID=2040274 RepID=UPI0039E99FB2